MLRVEIFLSTVPLLALSVSVAADPGHGETDISESEAESRQYQLLVDCSAPASSRERNVCEKLAAARGMDSVEGLSIWHKGDLDAFESQIDDVLEALNPEVNTDLSAEFEEPE